MDVGPNGLGDLVRDLGMVQEPVLYRDVGLCLHDRVFVADLRGTPWRWFGEFDGHACLLRSFLT